MKEYYVPFYVFNEGEPDEFYKFYNCEMIYLDNGKIYKGYFDKYDTMDELLNFTDVDDDDVKVFKLNEYEVERYENLMYLYNEDICFAKDEGGNLDVLED